MGVTLENINAWAMQHAQLLLFVTISIAVFCLALVMVTVSQSIFRIYKKTFYSQVDKGLRDVLVLIEPSQVFSVTVVAALVIGPTLYFFTNLVFALVLVAIILVAPTFVLRMMKTKRSNQFVEQLPDALAAMSSALRSGLNLVKSIQQVVKNQPHPLAQEFAQVLVEYRVGTDMNDSMDQLAKRIDRQEVVLMNSAIRISRLVGGNLADTMETLSKTLREKSKVEGKVRALTSMGKAQGVLASVFPVFIGYVFYRIEPFAMSLLFTTRLGMIWLAVMITMGIIAYFLIRKIVTIDI